MGVLLVNVIKSRVGKDLHKGHKTYTRQLPHRLSKDRRQELEIGRAGGALGIWPCSQRQQIPEPGGDPGSSNPAPHSLPWASGHGVPGYPLQKEPLAATENWPRCWQLEESQPS